MDPFPGKNIIATGAGSGIGAAVVSLASDAMCQASLTGRRWLLGRPPVLMALITCFLMLAFKLRLLRPLFQTIALRHSIVIVIVV